MNRPLAGLLAAVLLGLCGSAMAQGFPAKPVRMIVGFAPGGATDIVARVLGQRLGEVWGQAVLVENRAGAGGNIASELVATSPPDGYVLLMGATNTHTINPHMYAKLAFDVFKDFTPITNVADTPMALVLHPSVPARTVAEFIALGKSKQGGFSAGSAGTGSAGHLAAAVFQATTGVPIVHIPYKGAGPAVADLLGGQIPVMFAPLAPISPHVKAGKLNLLAVTTARRNTMFPSTPTVAESGVPGFEVSSWFGLFGPARLPGPIVERIHSDVVRVLAEAGVRQKLLEQALDPVGNTPAQFAAQIRDEYQRYGKALVLAGVKPE